MDGYGSSSGAGGGGFPIRSSGGSGGAERMAQPLAHYANTNGVVSRPRGGGGEDGFGGGGGGGGGGGRAQQPSHEVFMVREASRGSLQASQSQEGRQSFATSGNRFQTESGGGGESSDQRQIQQQSNSSSHSTGHHRERSERDRDKERDHQQQQKQFPLPKMLKIAVVGESTAGKTAICNAFTSEGYNFSRNYHMTTGVSIYAKSIKLPSARPGAGGGEERNHQQSSSGPEDSLSSHLLETRINLVLVDSSGKPIYKELLPHYWDRLDGVALVLDLTSSTALESASDWLNLAKGSMISSQQNKKHVPPSDGSGDQTGNGSSKRGGGASGSDQSFLGVLIGSKTDLKDQRVISPKAAQDFASQHGLQYFECSAKENSGMEEPFFYLAHQWTTSVGSPADKENSSLDGDVTGSGGIFAMGKGNSNSHSSSTGGSSSTSKRSAFGSRQGSSSEAF